METITPFNPLTNTSGTFTAQTLQYGSTMVVRNKTYVDLLFTFTNGDKHPVLANESRAWVFSDSSAVPQPLVTWSQENIDYPQTVSQLENVCYVEVYSGVEKVAETYPMPIQRETLPSLVPYDIGHVSYGFNPASPAGNFTIFPSSYIGVADAPTTLGGLGYDHLYATNDGGFLIDTPGLYQATGKSQNGATIVNANLTSPVAGPFSLSGLPPKDTATFLNGTSWTLASTIPWSASTSGFMIDGWFFIENNPNQNMFIISDDYPPINNKGVAVYIDINGMLQFWCAFAGGARGHSSLQPVSLNQWHYFKAVYNGNAVNNIELFLDGVTQNTSALSSGAVVNALVSPSIGANHSGAQTKQFVGAIAYLGIFLGGIGPSAAARFEHGMQSLNTDYQNVWIDGIEIDVSNTVATNSSNYRFNNLFNPAGLLYSPTLASNDILHVTNPNNVEWFFNVPAFAANGSAVRSSFPPKPVTHPNTLFPVFTNFSGGNGTMSCIYTIHGYNILGVA